MNLSKALSKARTSRVHRWWLQHLLNWSIPFNRPHGFHVAPLPGGGIRVKVPYWRINRNHINGIHACAMATAAEMCSGLSVLELLDPRRFRLIMRSLQVEYHYQARKAAYATSMPAQEDIERRVLEPLKHADKVTYASTVRIEDEDGTHLATANVEWQIKEWEKVRTAK
ncbi:MAG: DUF4442 domain-containing protein [Flavobacteriales bacterium]|nr:DUF4442 domain-containing protein [Flavobacteriales bacterium]